MNMRSSFILFLLLFGSTMPTLKAAKVIEVINNTDEDLIIKCPGATEANRINIIASTSLKTGLKIQPLEQKSPYRTTFARRTRNIVNGITIPIELVNTHHEPKQQARSADWIYSSSLSMTMGGCYYCDNVHPGPFLGLYQKGTFLGIDGCNGVARVRVSDQTMSENSFSYRWGCITGENIDAQDYSIEVKQLTPMISYYQEAQAARCLMKKNTLEISIKKANSSDLVVPQNTGTPKAYIVNFYPGTITYGQTKVGVAFDQVVTDEFTQKFCEFMKNLDNMRKLSKVSIKDYDGKRYISFDIYTSMTQSDFQSLLDRANKQAFPS